MSAWDASLASDELLVCLALEAERDSLAPTDWFQLPPVDLLAWRINLPIQQVAALLDLLEQLGAIELDEQWLYVRLRLDELPPKKPYGERVE